MRLTACDRRSLRGLAGRRVLVLSILLSGGGWLVGSAAAAEVVRVVWLSPRLQSARPAGLVPVPFKLRVERLDGEPIAGVQVRMLVQISCPAEPPCPDGRGEFEPSEPGSPFSGIVTTGSDGTATFPPYRVGIPQPLPALVGFEPRVVSSSTPGGIIITGVLGENEASGVMVEGVQAVPTLGGVASVTLAALIAAAGLWALRRARAA